MNKNKTVDPSWTLEEAVEIVSTWYRPGSMVGGAARNAAISAWAVAVGRKRAQVQMQELINKYGSRSRAAKALRMSSKTLSSFEISFAQIAELPEDNQHGLSLYFSTHLAPMERWLIDGTIWSVLGPNTQCRVIEYSERNEGNGAIIRLQSPNQSELEIVADALCQRYWKNLERSLPAKTHRLYFDDMFSETLQKYLTVLFDKLERLTIRNQFTNSDRLLEIFDQILVVEHLDFSRLDGHRFEELLNRYLNASSEWTNVEWYGEVGDDDGWDIAAIDCHGHRTCFLCANYQPRMTARKAEQDINKLSSGYRGLPSRLILVAGGRVSPKLKQRLEQHGNSLGIGSVEVWTGKDFEARLKEHTPGLVHEFFGPRIRMLAGKKGAGD